MGLIFHLSSGPVPKAVEGLHQPDYVLHSIEYAILSALLFRALNKGWTQPGPFRYFPMAMILSVLYGISDEWHQSFVPTRDSSLHDLFFDLVGSFLGVLLIFVYQRWRRHAIKTSGQMVEP